MINTDLRMWWRYTTLQFQAHRWLKANDTAVLAARLLFRLNRYAGAANRWGQYHERENIYQVKTAVIRWLCEQGYCTAVTLQRQTLWCRNCAGTGTYNGAYEGDCSRCDGTGIYREHILVRFAFNVSGQTYIWHQPQRFVDWPVRPDFSPIAEYNQVDSYQPPDEAWLPTNLIELYLITLREFVRMQGIKLDWYRPSLRTAVRSVWRQWQDRVERRWHRSKWHGRYRVWQRLWLFLQVGDWEEVEMIEYERELNDIPF